MRRKHFDPYARPEEEMIAGFGEAHITRDLAGRWHLRGGSESERREALEWARLFLSDVRFEPERDLNSPPIH